MDQLLVYVRALFLEHGIPIVFIAGLAEATVGLGIVFPGVVIMFLGGAATAADPGRLLLVVAAASVGTMIGDTISYSVGRFGGRRLMSTRWGPQLRMGSALISGRALWFIPFYHLYSVTRAVGPFGAGAIRLPLRVWVPLDFLGAVISNSIWIGAGALLGTAVLTPEGKLEEHPLIRLTLVAIGVAWFVLLNRTIQRRMRALRRDAERRQEQMEAVAVRVDRDG
jgi:membrane protein DedA with SNARE-associated domain